MICFRFGVNAFTEHVHNNIKEAFLQAIFDFSHRFMYIKNTLKRKRDHIKCQTLCTCLKHNLQKSRF